MPKALPGKLPKFKQPRRQLKSTERDEAARNQTELEDGKGRRGNKEEQESRRGESTRAKRL